MQTVRRTKLWALSLLSCVVSALAVTACQDEAPAPARLLSDWEAPPAADGSRPYVIDWACQPKRFDSSAETEIYEQEEYCEWRVVATDDTTKTCQFTTSFDNSRDFYLNSRGRTRFNSVGAAQELRDACAEVALARLRQGKPVGQNCTNVSAGGCVPGRNSDPEICSRVRYMVGQNYNQVLDFTIDQMPAGSTRFTKLPLMRMGLLTALPAGCAYSQADKTEVTCSVPKESSCFALTGQLRVGLRVLTTPYAGSDQTSGEPQPLPEGEDATPAGGGNRGETVW